MIYLDPVDLVDKLGGQVVRTDRHYLQKTVHHRDSYQNKSRIIFFKNIKMYSYIVS